MTTRETVEDQARVITISAASDAQELVMEPVAAPQGVWGEYFWSRSPYAAPTASALAARRLRVARRRLVTG